MVSSHSGRFVLSGGLSPAFVDEIWPHLGRLLQAGTGTLLRRNGDLIRAQAINPYYAAMKTHS